MHVRIHHSSHEIANQSSRPVHRTGWQAKMASIEFWIPWRNAHGPHCIINVINYLIYPVKRCIHSAKQLKVSCQLHHPSHQLPHPLYQLHHPFLPLHFSSMFFLHIKTRHQRWYPMISSLTTHICDTISQPSKSSSVTFLKDISATSTSFPSQHRWLTHFKL